MSLKRIFYLVVLIFIPAHAFSYPLDSIPDTTVRVIYDDHIYLPSVKTVLLHPIDQPLKFPLLRLNSAETLKLSFDDMSDDYRSFRYTLIHCDASWNPSGLLPEDYLEGFTDDGITESRQSFNTTIAYIHYNLILPNQSMKPKLSGNYLLLVYEGTRENLVLSRRLMIVDEQVRVTGNVHQATAVEEKKYRQEVDFSISTGSYRIDDPFRDLHVCISQNGRKDNSICSLKPLYVKDNLLEYDYESENVFDGGSEFRLFDARSFRQAGERIVAIRRDTGIHLIVEKDMKRSYQRYVFDNDINGNFRVKTYDGKDDDLESEYVWVHLKVQCEEPYSDGSLYVMGAFNGWQFTPESRMTFDLDEKAYKAALYLKQGYYNYLYVFVPLDSAKVDTSVVEGDHFETENDYRICVYHRASGTRYDRLVSVTYLNSLTKN